MAEEQERSKQYDYKTNSNLVLERDRRGLRRTNEPTGEVESLRDRMGGTRMGDRVKPDKPNVESVMLKKRKRDGVGGGGGLSNLKNLRVSKGQVSVLTEMEEVEVGSYRPKTKETASAYSQLLSFTQQRLGDQPASVLAGAADEILAHVKDKEATPKQQLQECRLLLGGNLNDIQFNVLLEICKGITDYVAHVDQDDVGEEERVEDEVGVAVVFDDEEDDGGDEDEAEDLEMEVRDIESDDEVGAASVLANKNSGVAGSSSEADRPAGVLAAAEIEAYWLQRQLKEYYNDANESQRLATETLTILGEQDKRACENKLVLLLGFDKFDLIKQLLENRNTIYYCTRLKQAQSEAEKNEIEAEMKANGHQKILDELSQKAGAASWEKDRMGEFNRRAQDEARALAEKLGSGEQAEEDKEDDERDRGSRKTKPNQKEVRELKFDLGTGGGFDKGEAPSRELDLSSFEFAQGDHLNSNKKFVLPPGTWEKKLKGYEEVHVPPLKPKPFDKDEKLIPIADLPKWAQAAFVIKGKMMKSLNRVQSKIYETALWQKDSLAPNLLVCAPTGAGKTNVAMLTMLHEIGRYRREGSAEIDTVRMQQSLKIIYVAPMKALVQEVVENFTNRLTQAYGVNVRELSGDQSLTKAEIADTQIIVTTPEKWDIITRKSGERAYTQLVKLLIIDEIHLLHNERGAVLEGIVARTLRQQEQTQKAIRIVGISATLPNFQDVAKFLRVKPSEGLFFFDNSFRPVPLQQQYIGITEKKALKRFQLMNEICYSKISTSLKQNAKDQILVFVHTRNETQKTAEAMNALAVERGEVDLFVNENQPEAKEVLQSEAETSVKHAALKELLPCGIGIHHAGMVRSDRNLVEDLFTQGYIRVLVSTATLAWGVNLPAHTVIIKGTQVYNPEKGRWIELSQLDVLQMLGRAGRPQFDTEGQGVIITTHSELRYYLSLLNEQLPIESQLVQKLPDMLNAEIVMGTIQSVKEASVWLGYTYLYVRMRRNPALYGCSVDEIEQDKLLLQRRVDMIHSAALLLDKAQLIRYDRRTGGFQVTALGKIASHYYVTYDSMAVYNQHLRPTMGDIEAFRVFSFSKEFKNIIVRTEEKLELAKLVERAPIPVKESIEEPTAKVNVLLQAYISHLRLDGYAIACDLVYIHQSAGRLVRALFEICLSHGWASLSLRFLDLANMVEHQVWTCHHFLRQLVLRKQGRGPLEPLPSPLNLVTIKTIQNLERNHLTPEQYFVLSPQELGELSGQGGIKLGRALHRMVHAFPRLELKAKYQPIAPTMLSIELTITPNFEYIEAILGRSQSFWIIVEDCNGSQILHHEQFTLKASMVNIGHEDELAINDITKVFTVPITRDPLPPQYFIKVVSDRYLHCISTTSLPFRNLILPGKYPAPTQLLDLLPLPVADIKAPDEFKAVLAEHTHVLNPIQTQTFSAVFEGDENVLVGAPEGSDHLVCAELALLRQFLQNRNSRCAYVAPFDELCQVRLARWQKSFGAKLKLSVAKLTGETSVDLKLLARSNIIVATPDKWDMISRRWKQRKAVQTLSLFIVDQLHAISGKHGPTLELVVSRMRYITAQTKQPIRLVALCSSMANVNDVGSWLGCSTDKMKQTLFNFHPSARPVPLEIFIRGFSEHHFGTRMLEMSKLLYGIITRHTRGQQQTIVFVPSRTQAQLSAIDILTYAAASGNGLAFLASEEAKKRELLTAVEKVSEGGLKLTLKAGVGFIHEGLRATDRAIVDACFQTGAIRVLVQTASGCWGMAHKSSLVVVMGTSRFEGGSSGYTEYPVMDMMNMMGKAAHGDSSKCVVLCHQKKKEYYKKFLFTPLPVESRLDEDLADHLCAEVVTKTIKDKQHAVDYMTWTFYYRRLTKNPNYYGLKGTTDFYINDHLSELIEEKLADLEDANCISIENDMDLAPLNLGIIASYYYISYSTVDFFSSCLKAKCKFKTLLEILASATEFEQVPVRHREDKTLSKIFKRVKLHISYPNMLAARTKANILLQCHFSRVPLSTDMRQDQKVIVVDSIRLLQAMIDIISSNGWLRPALVAMEMSQMVVQGRWKTDSPLLQIPHFDAETVERCKAAKVTSIFDIMDLEDDTREKLLQLDEAQMADVANFCNAYPDLEARIEVLNKDDLQTGQTVEVAVSIERSVDDEDEDEDMVYGQVVSDYFPKAKTESWWVVLGDPAQNTLYTIKRFTLDKKKELKLAFEAPRKEGTHALTLYIMADSVLGCDQEHAVSLTLQKGDDGRSSDSSSGTGSD